MTARHDRAFLHQTELDEAEILVRVRRGDRHAYGLLYERHVTAARRVAQAILRRSSDVDDAVSEGFAAAFAAIRRGKGPTDCFGPYIKSCVRHECFRLMRRAVQTTPARSRNVDDDGELDADEYERLDEAEVLKVAFESLPARMKTVLWYTEVEGLSHAEVAGETGGSTQAIAQMAVRARRELTTQYLQAHLAGTSASSNECRDVRDRLAEIVRGTASRRVSTKTAAHLAVCADCASAQQSLVAVNSRLRTQPLAALLTGIATPVLVKLGWKARLVATISLPASNLTAISGLMVVSTAVGPVPSSAVPPSAADGATIEIVGESAPVGLESTALVAASPSGLGVAETDTDTDPTLTARPRVVADVEPTSPRSPAASSPATAAVPSSTVVTGEPPSLVTTVPGLPVGELPVDVPLEVTIGPGLDTDVSVGVPDLVPGDINLPLPPTSVAVTVPALPPISLPVVGPVVPPIDTGASVGVSTGSTGAGASAGVGGVDLDIVVDVNRGIDIGLDLGLD